jgi:hypothetical protein
MPNTSATPPTDTDRMLVISGVVTTMYVTDGTLNLLEGMQNKMLAIGLGSAVQGLAGGVANAAMIAMYEGENVQHFGCYIGEQMVIGTFENIGFKEGEEVKLIVTPLDAKVVRAHAVLRPKDAMLWLPFSINKGRWGIAKWCLIACLGFLFFSLLLFGLMHLFSPSKNGYLSLVAELSPIFILGSLFLGGGAYYSSRHDAHYAERLFKILGFKDPWKVNIAPYSEARLGTGDSYQVYHLRKALAAYDSLPKPAAKPAPKP